MTEPAEVWCVRSEGKRGVKDVPESSDPSSAVHVLLTGQPPVSTWWTAAVILLLMVLDAALLPVGAACLWPSQSLSLTLMAPLSFPHPHTCGTTRLTWLNTVTA